MKNVSNMAKPKKLKTSKHDHNKNANALSNAKVECYAVEGIRGFPPRLLHDKNKFKSSQLEVEALVPNAVYVSRNALSSSECQDWIEFAEDESKFEVVNHPSTRLVAHRE